MQMIAISITAMLAMFAQAFKLPHASLPDWHPPAPGDARGPCPLLNTLANHEYLPHNGRNISEALILDVLDEVLNINRSFSSNLFRNALTTVTTPDPTTFSLDDLSAPKVLEHDASLSRGDIFFGDNHSFNQTIFDQTKSYWDPILNLQTVANARQARVAACNASNPEFTFAERDETNTFTQNSFLILFFGDRVTGVGSKEMVEYLFEHERLPIEMGWTKPHILVSDFDVSAMRDRLRAATKTC